MYWWAHVTFVESMIALNDFFGTPLTLAEKDQLVREGVTWWQGYGLSNRPVLDDDECFRPCSPPANASPEHPGRGRG